MNWFRSVVSALCYSIIKVEPIPGSLPARSKNEVVNFVQAQIVRCPLHLRAPLMIATLGIDVLGVPFGGKLLHFYDGERRVQVMERISHIPFGPLAEVFKFYQSLALLCAWDQFERAAGE